VSAQVKAVFVPTVSVSVGVACVSVPSVPWMVKLNVPAAVLPSVTVNGAPAVVGSATVGAIVHIPGAPAVQINATLPAYPSIAVSAPFQVTFWLVTVVLGVAVSASEKSAPAAVTVSSRVCVFAAGAPAVIAATVRMIGPPNGVDTPAVTVNVTVTGAEELGLTEPDGEKTQVAPLGSPAGQLRVTVPEKLPAAVT
jgi:hypothetical protein